MMPRCTPLVTAGRHVLAPAPATASGWRAAEQQRKRAALLQAGRRGPRLAQLAVPPWWCGAPGRQASGTVEVGRLMLPARRSLGLHAPTRTPPTACCPLPHPWALGLVDAAAPNGIGVVGGTSAAVGMVGTAHLAGGRAASQSGRARAVSPTPASVHCP
jgi:hypothetical protein